jgi:hypothetical protein
MSPPCCHRYPPEGRWKCELCGYQPPIGLIEKMQAERRQEGAD